MSTGFSVRNFLAQRAFDVPVARSEAMLAVANPFFTRVNRLVMNSRRREKFVAVPINGGHHDFVAVLWRAVEVFRCTYPHEIPDSTLDETSNRVKM